MTCNRRIAPILTTLLALCVSAAVAAEPKPFSQQTFDQLAHDGKPVIVDVAAPWCPTCLAQKPIVSKLAGQAAYKDVAVLIVDFDNDKPALKFLGAGPQSTLIAFKSGKEVARTIGDTTPAGIESLFKKVLP